MQPLHDKVLIKLEGADAISKGGIYIPEMARERAIQHGIVIAIGNEALIVKSGDKVILAKFAGNEIEIDKVRHIIVKEEDILAKEES